jgi:hypothetical protein
MQAKILAAALTTIFLTVSTFAVPVYSLPGDNSDTQRKEDSQERNKHGKGNHFRQRWVEFEKDPLKVLDEKKEKVQILLKEGKITKDQADEINKRIDENIKTVKDFNKLSLEDKKKLLLEQFNAAIDKRAKAGKITNDFADELKQEYRSKIENWDGQGYPGFLVRGVLFKDKHKHDEACPKGLEKPDKRDKPDAKPDKQLKPESKEKPESKDKPESKEKPVKQQR